MDREERLHRLPALYAEALRLADNGYDHAAIAEALGLNSAAVGPLLEIGEAKLDRLRDEPGEPPVNREGDEDRST